MAASVTSVNLESTRAMRLSARGSISEARRSAMVWDPPAGLRGRSGLPVRLQDSSDLTSSPISVVVHDHGVEAVGGLLLLLGSSEASLERLGIVLPPLEEPAPLLLPRARPGRPPRGARRRRRRGALRRGHAASHRDRRTRRTTPGTRPRRGCART